MEWSDVAETVGKVAPTLGGMFAGPAGAGAGALLARALGVEETPEAVSKAVQADPQAALKVREVEAGLEKAYLNASVERQRMVNKTMQAEAKQEGWFRYGWRPAMGWVFTLSLGSMVGVMAVAVARDHTLVTNSEFTGMLVWLFATMGGTLGLYIKKRSDDKGGGAAPGFIDRMLKR